ncbi:MAG: hypothetical protein U0531_01895 [Dehalococcoidia bacterium]
MKVTILDDYFDTLRTLPCSPGWRGTTQRSGTTTSRRRTRSPSGCAAARLVLIRERTRIQAPVLERLPRLRLISQRSVYPHIDIDACTRLGVIVSSNQHPGTPSYAAAEADLGTGAGGGAAVAPPDRLATGRELADGRGHDAARQDARRLRLRAASAVVAGYGRAFGMRVLVWAAEASRARAVAEGYQAAASKEDFFAACDVLAAYAPRRRRRAASSPPPTWRG